MLKALTFAALVVVGSAFPITEDAHTVSKQVRGNSVAVEISNDCYYPAGTTCSTKAQNITGDTDDGQKTGVVVNNKDCVAHSYFFYQNSCDCVPWKYISIPANGTKFVALNAGFQGRMMRGTEAANLDGKTHLLGTWTEFSWDADGRGWADVSLIKGCDGAVDIKAIDGIGASVGFNTSVLDDAPPGAYKRKSTGSKVIMETEALGDYTKINTIPRDWLAGKIGYKKAYIDDHHGNPDICSVNGRFAINFWPGRP